MRFFHCQLARLKVFDRYGLKLILPFLVALTCFFLLSCSSSGGDTAAPATTSTPAVPAADFTLTVTATLTSPISIGEAAPKDVTVTAARLNGQTGDIVLTLDSPPTGISGSGTILSGTTTGIFTITVTPAVAVDMAALTIKGTSGSLVRTALPTTNANVVRVAGALHLTAFEITAPNTVDDPAQVCVIDDALNTVTAPKRGRTVNHITVTFNVDAGGTAKFNGATITSPADLDLFEGQEISVVDINGRQQIYALNILDSGLPAVFIRTALPLPGTFPNDKSPISGFCKIRGTTVIGVVGYATETLAELPITVQGRGNTTLDLPKKPYRINFNAKTAVFPIALGATTYKKWVLLANYADKSLIRNYVAFETARTMDHLAWTPNTLPVDLYFNGKYQGSYSMGDQLEVGATRVNIANTAADDTGYLLEVNGRLLSEDPTYTNYFTTGYGYIVDCKSPGTCSKDVGTQNAYIKTIVQSAEDALIGGSGASVDFDSFIDWLIIEELFKNTDSRFHASVYMHRNTGGKLVMGPVWDFDLSSGNSNTLEVGPFAGFTLYNSSGWFAGLAAWFNNGGPVDTLQQPAFVKAAIKARWNEDIGGTLTARLKTIVAAKITAAKARVLLSQQMNFHKWPITDWVENNGWEGWFTTSAAVKAAITYDAQVQVFSDWMDARFTWMDAEIATY